MRKIHVSETKNYNFSGSLRLHDKLLFVLKLTKKHQYGSGLASLKGGPVSNISGGPVFRSTYYYFLNEIGPTSSEASRQTTKVTARLSYAPA